MNDKYILVDGKPVKCENIAEWGQWFEKDDRKIDHTIISDTGDEYVSTVFLGLDHSFGDGPPILFETMVFGGPLDQEMDRYATMEEAQAGHLVMVAKASSA